MSSRRRQKKINASPSIGRFLRVALGAYLWMIFRQRAENREIFRRIRPPFLVLGNHTCVWDPFLVNSLVPHPIHYLVTDASFRSRLVTFGLSLVGGIPKTKGMSDMDSIKNIVRVRDRGGVVGIFPEGQNTWDGHTLPIVHSTAKLAKLLRVPVVTARSIGAYFSRPRWAKGVRHGRVIVRFDVALTSAELRKASVQEIDSRISELLEHDETEFNRQAGVKFLGRDRAEYLERALFMCPACSRVSTLRSEANTFRCTVCGYTVHYSLTGTFRQVHGDLVFDSIRDWNLWQLEKFSEELERYAVNGNDAPFIADDEVRVQIGFRSRPLAPFHTGCMELRGQSIILRPDGVEPVEFPVDAIRGANVQNDEHWEFYCGADLFKVTITDPRGCTYKWDVAVRLLKSRNDKNRSVE